MIKNTCVSLLYPYFNQIITNAVVQAGFSPLILQPIVSSVEFNLDKIDIPIQGKVLEKDNFQRSWDNFLVNFVEWDLTLINSKELRYGFAKHPIENRIVLLEKTEDINNPIVDSIEKKEHKYRFNRNKKAQWIAKKLLKQNMALWRDHWHHRASYTKYIEQLQ